MDQRFPVPSDLGVYLAALGRDHGTGERADVVVLLGNGGVVVVEEEEEAGMGAEVQGGAFQDEVEVSSEQSVAGEEGHASGSLERSRGLRRGREGE